MGKHGSHDSISTVGQHPGSCGQRSPSTVSSASPYYGSHATITPVVSHSGIGGGTSGAGLPGFRDSPTSSSPVGYPRGHPRDNAMIDRGQTSSVSAQASHSPNTHHQDAASVHAALQQTRMEPLPRIIPIEDPNWRSTLRGTTLPPLNIDAMSHPETDVPGLSARRSGAHPSRTPSHLNYEGATKSSTSSGSTSGSYNPRTPADGMPFQRVLPAPPSISDGCLPYASLPRLTHPMHVPIDGLSPNAHPSSLSSPQSHHRHGGLHSASVDSSSYGLSLPGASGDF